MNYCLNDRFAYCLTQPDTITETKHGRVRDLAGKEWEYTEAILKCTLDWQTCPHHKNQHELYPETATVV